MYINIHIYTYILVSFLLILFIGFGGPGRSWQELPVGPDA